MTKKIKKFSRVKSQKETGLVSGIRRLTEGLVYISELDAAIQVFIGEAGEETSGASILKQLGGNDDLPVEEVSFDQFFSRLTKTEDRYSDKEKQIVWRFRKLKEFLESNLDNLKVFRIGRVQIDIYVVGVDKKGRLIGIRTRSIET